VNKEIFESLSNVTKFTIKAESYNITNIVDQIVNDVKDRLLQIERNWTEKNEEKWRIIKNGI
jgi:predicted DNA-binding protein